MFVLVASDLRRELMLTKSIAARTTENPGEEGGTTLHVDASGW